MSELGFAARLRGARLNRQAIFPLSQEVELTASDAYEIQDAVLALEPGTTIVAAKLGLTSRAKQAQMNVDEPLYGWMTADMDLRSRGVLSVDRYIQPRAEPEIAFSIGADLFGSRVDRDEVLAATTAVMPAIDILDSRFTGYKFTLPDVVADNASAAAFVAGPLTTFSDFDLGLVGCVFTRNGEVVATATGAETMGHPAEAVAWLARALTERGLILRAGTLVLSGALTSAFPVVAGDSYLAEFDRIGSVSLQAS